MRRLFVSIVFITGTFPLHAIAADPVDKTGQPSQMQKTNQQMTPGAAKLERQQSLPPAPPMHTKDGGRPGPSSAFKSWQVTPAMGWNSWDCFGTTVTEAQTKAQADVMADKLKAHGWQYIVVDIQWYEPLAKGFHYRKDASLVMDGWGRLLPAENRFPSAADGAGFKALARHVHDKGLKFGVHLMRGIPRQAVERNLPVKDTPHRAADIADTNSFCKWNPDMYGVDMSKPGAQEYYDSVFELFAEWGVDFVKVDDLSRPYDTVQKAEIEGIRKAIDKTGRPMVLSMSPGETPLAEGDHVKNHANMWRISDDFWDSWDALFAQFKRLDDWTPHRGEGCFPDADMLPLGAIRQLEQASSTPAAPRAPGEELPPQPPRTQPHTEFTPDEQVTMMTLWSIARSPLIMGGDLTKLDDWTLSLLTNDEVLAVNQHSSGNHQLFSCDGFIAWIADAPDSKDKYLAVFNTTDTAAEMVVELKDFGLGGTAHVRDLWKKSDFPVAGRLAPLLPAHGAALYRVSRN